MLARTFTTALLGSALLVMPAMAQMSNTNSTNSSSQQINASTSGHWQASQLIHLNVYNTSNEKVGDIKELMMDKSGKIDQVVIGVGGFLGIGERDVALKFSDLTFSDQPVTSSTGASTTTSNRTTSGSGASTTTTSANTTMTGNPKNYPDHAVINMTKDQLKSMPQFNYSK